MPSDETPRPGRTPTPLVELEAVSVVIGDTCVLREVTATLPAAGISLVLGPSGSGKSTLLRLINRLEVPTSGTVRFRGEDVAGLDPLALRRRVGMVFQRPTPFPGSVGDNLRVAAPDATGAVLGGLLERCGLPASFCDRDTTGLSGGEAQRVCLARALAAGPEALLMDEPTASLDPENRAVVEELVQALAADGMPVVWVTHDLEQADRLSDTALVLVGGRVATAEEAATFRRDGAP